jgi:hypothetical protein
MNKALVLLAIILAIAGTAVAPEHKDGGADLIITAGLILLLSINFIRSGLRGLLTKKSKDGSRKGSVIALILLIALLASLYRFGPVTTFESIRDWVKSAIEWLKQAADNAGKGRQA